MMYESLYQYFIQHKQLSVPGIGTFILERTPAVVNFPEKKMDPPAYAVRLQPSGQVPSRSFFNWLAAALQLSDREAVICFNDFAFELKKSVLSGAQISWNGMGQLSKGLGGEIRFVPVKTFQAEAPVTAEKPIREKAAHMVRVGEDERTSAEMTEFLRKADEKRDYWWAWALVIGLAAITFIGLNFSQKGVSMSSSANPGLIKPLESGTGYRVIQ